MGRFYVDLYVSEILFELTGFLNEKLILGHSVQEVVISAYGSVYSGQMYFLFSLFLVRLCSPIFRKVVFIKKYFVILLLFYCYYITYKSTISSIFPYLNIEGGQEPVLHALWGIQFYLLGIACFKTSEIFDLKKLFIPFLLLFIFALLIQNKFEYHWFNIQYLYLITIFLFFTFFQNGISLPKMIGIIGENTMGIYFGTCPYNHKRCVSHFE